MTPADALQLIIRPSLAWMSARTGLKLASPEAEVMLLAIGLQESMLADRDQGSDEVDGPALGFWQFEVGGLTGVLRHDLSRRHMLNMLTALRLPTAPGALWRIIEHADHAAVIAARMLLWTHPKPLPACDDAWGAWAYYTWLWRPGKPHPATWQGNHDTAVEAVAIVPALTS